MSRSFIYSYLVLLIVCSAFADETSHHHEQAKANEVEVGNTGVGDMKQDGVVCTPPFFCCRANPVRGINVCLICCLSEEAKGFENEAETDKNIENSEIDGYGGHKGHRGGGCGKFKCCGYGRYGGCDHCCSNTEEAKAFAKEIEAMNTVNAYSGRKRYGGRGCGKFSVAVMDFMEQGVTIAAKTLRRP